MMDASSSSSRSETSSNSRVFFRCHTRLGYSCMGYSVPHLTGPSDGRRLVILLEADAAERPPLVDGRVLLVHGHAKQVHGAGNHVPRQRGGEEEEGEDEQHPFA